MRTYYLTLFALLGLIASSSAQVVKFQPATNTANCLTVQGNSQSDLAPIIAAPCGTPTTNFQKFGVTNTGVTVYWVQPEITYTTCSQKCLDVISSVGDSDRVTQQDCNPGRLNQYWSQAPGGSLLPNYFWYQNWGTNRCMTAESLGSYVDQWECTSGLHQQWITAEDPTNPGSTIQNQFYALTNPCLNVLGSNPNNGAGTSSAPCTSGAYNQLFNVQALTPWRFKISGSNKCMDGGGSPSTIYQYTCTSGARNHMWTQSVFPNEENPLGNYFVDMLSGLCLTYDPTNLNNIHMETCVQGNLNQQWLTAIA